MNKIGSYNMFQNNYYDKSKVKNSTTEKTAQKKADSVKKEQTAGVNANKQPQLSDRAKALLEELKKKYTDMDFMVAEYETEEEASEYLSRGTKAFSVLIDPKTLEEMATDEEVKEKYLQVMEDSRTQLSDMIEELDDEEEQQIKRVGVSIDRDGTVSYFAELEKTNAKQQERIEKSREEKAEKEKKAEKNEKAEKQEEALQKAASDKRKKAFVEADSIEELLEKIRSFNWDEVQETEVKRMGGKIDFTA